MLYLTFNDNSASYVQLLQRFHLSSVQMKISVEVLWGIQTVRRNRSNIKRFVNARHTRMHNSVPCHEIFYCWTSAHKVTCDRVRLTRQFIEWWVADAHLNAVQMGGCCHNCTMFSLLSPRSLRHDVTAFDHQWWPTLEYCAFIIAFIRAVGGQCFCSRVYGHGAVNASEKFFNRESRNAADAVFVFTEPVLGEGEGRGCQYQCPSRSNDRHSTQTRTRNSVDGRRRKNLTNGCHFRRTVRLYRHSFEGDLNWIEEFHVRSINLFKYSLADQIPAERPLDRIQHKLLLKCLSKEHERVKNSMRDDIRIQPTTDQQVRVHWTTNSLVNKCVGFLEEYFCLKKREVIVQSVALIQWMGFFSRH